MLTKQLKTATIENRPIMHCKLSIEYVHHVCLQIVSLLMPYWFKFQNGYFDSKYFWNWSDECCWCYIYNWININVSKFLGFFPHTLETSRRYIEWISFVSEQIFMTWKSWSFLPKTHFLDIFEIFRLDIGQISFNVVKKASATKQLVFLPVAWHFMTSWLRHTCIAIKILRWESDLRLPRLGFCIFFSLFLFSLFFSFCCRGGLLMGLLAVKNLQRKRHRDEQILPWSSHV